MTTQLFKTTLRFDTLLYGFVQACRATVRRRLMIVASMTLCLRQWVHSALQRHGFQVL
jgi:hypothetical protein